MKIKVKLLKDYAGHKKGVIIEEEESIARAYIGAGIGEEQKPKVWIKLLRDHGTHKKDAIIEEEDTVARAFITAGAAEEHRLAPEALAAAARAELDTALNELRTAAVEQTRQITQSLEQTRTALRPRPQVGGEIIATESEDDKFLQHGGGFRSLGHQAHCIYRGLNPGSPDPTCATLLRTFNERYNRVAGARNEQARALGSPDGMFENADPDGGQLIAPQFSNTIWERVYEQNALLQLVDGYTVTSNTMSFPRNSETSRADGSRWGGTLGYWEGEAQQYTGSRPKFDNLNLRLKKLTILTYTTNELLSDAGIALDQYLNKKASDEIAFKINDSLINGTGAGIPQGIINSPAFVSVTKDTNQASKTISFTNVLNVYNTAWGPGRARSVWVYNQEVEPQLWTMTLPVGTAGWPVYLPPGTPGTNAGAKPQATFYGGLPMICLEQCPGLGLVGDLMLVDFSQVVAITKGGLMSSMSIHLKFDYDETVFKWTFRMDAQSAWTTSLTPYKTNTSKVYSHAVGIAARP